MIGFLLRATIVGVGLWLASRLVPGVEIRTTAALIWAALLLGLVNAIIRPVLVILTLPITLLTLGLFLLVVNGLMVELVTALLPDFVVHGFGSAVLCALVVSLTSWFVSWCIGPRGKFEVVIVRR